MSTTQTIKAATVPVQIPVKRLVDLLVGSFEGGSNYWMSDIRIVYPPGVNASRGREMLQSAGREMGIDEDIIVHNPVYLAPFVDGFGIEVNEQESSGSPELKPLTLESLEAGLRIMASGKLVFHFNDIIAENDDATTSDVLVQLAVFGELVYG